MGSELGRPTRRRATLFVALVCARLVSSTRACVGNETALRVDAIARALPHLAPRAAYDRARATATRIAGDIVNDGDGYVIAEYNHLPAPNAIDVSVSLRHRAAARAGLLARLARDEISVLPAAGVGARARRFKTVEIGLRRWFQKLQLANGSHPYFTTTHFEFDDAAAVPGVYLEHTSLPSSRHAEAIDGLRDYLAGFGWGYRLTRTHEWKLREIMRILSFDRSRRWSLQSCGIMHSREDYFGASWRRGIGAVRLNVLFVKNESQSGRDTLVDSIIEFLRTTHWEGDFSELTKLTKLIDYEARWGIVLSFDVPSSGSQAQLVGPNIGVEVYPESRLQRKRFFRNLLRMHLANPRWLRNLEKALCFTDTATTLPIPPLVRSWLKTELDACIKEVSNDEDLSIGISHIKLSIRGRAKLFVKVYISATRAADQFYIDDS